MDEFDKLLRSAADTIERQFEAKATAFLERTFRSKLKVVFDEEEAAAFLGVSIDTLQAWRKAKLISFTQYPSPKVQGLGRMYSYDIADLLSFRDRYKQRANAADEFQLARTVNLAGPEALRRAA